MLWGLLVGLILAAEPQPRTSPFWNAKAPADWSAEEVRELLRQSPWATVSAATMGPRLNIHLASAEPMREAETRERLALRYPVQPGASFEEYQSMLKDGRTSHWPFYFGTPPRYRTASNREAWSTIRFSM